jgi:formamidopyrimidine-DNA glycosylase
MPELPDVEVLKRYLDSTSLHKKIEKVNLKETQMLDGIKRKDFESGLKGRKLISTRRRGKYLLVEMDNNDWLEMHFGMTGGLKYFKNQDDQPEYTQLLIHFENGYYLAYIMTRKLGTLSLLKDVDEFIREKELGPDPLDHDFDLYTFKQVLQGRRGMVKSTLMNQKVLAGLGNVYTDEILFQARIHPRTKVNNLDERQLRTLYDCMMEVLNTAIDHQAKPETFPKFYLIPLREEGQDCPGCSGKVKKIKVSGRSCYFCPDCQEQ